MRKLFAKAQDRVSCETHAFGAAAALCGALVNVLRGMWTDAAVPAVAAAMCFCLSMAALYAASAVYHYYPGTAASGGVKRMLRKMDHSMIYVLIAGSYTPIALSVIGGWQGVVIAVVQWAMVLFGIFYKSLSRRSLPAVSLTIYLVMGWTILFFLPLFLRNASTQLLWLIAAGGLFYTLGAWFYARKGFRYHHLVWHLLINLGAACHFAGIVFYLY